MNAKQGGFRKLEHGAQVGNSYNIMILHRMFHKKHLVFDFLSFFLLQADQVPPWCRPTSSASIPDPETLCSGSQNEECPVYAGVEMIFFQQVFSSYFLLLQSNPIYMIRVFT